MRSCDGLVDSLLYVIHTCVNTSDYDSKVRGPSLAVTASARLRVPPHLLGAVWIHSIRPVARSARPVSPSAALPVHGQVLLRNAVSLARCCSFSPARGSLRLMT